jgi:hypothetical protein
MAQFDVNSPWIYILGPIWLICVIAASVLYRSTRGKPVSPDVPGDARFVERWTSGRSLDTPWGRIGGAHNCLMVAVTHDSVMVAPHFPFSLMFLPEIYGLELAAPRAAVAIEKISSGLFGRGLIRAVDGPTSRRIELRLRDKSGFIAALEAAPALRAVRRA